MQKWYNYNIESSSWIITWRKIMNFKKIIAVFAAICISLGVSGALIPEAAALDASYEVSAEYKESKYYKNLKHLSLGADQVANVIAVALSQVGYHEGDDNADLGGMNTEGTRDFVEYNVLFGELDNNQGNGKSYGYSWCASFATWCLRQAGVSAEQSAQNDPKTNRSSWQWRRAFIEAERYSEKEGYAPKAGDIIFFKDVNDPSLEVAASHVGIVLFANETTVYTVEGNTNSTFEAGSVSDCVAVKEYSLDSKYIVGYGTPEYSNDGAKQLLGWKVASSLSDPADLDELYGELREGKHVVPVWNDDISVIVTNAFKIAAVILIVAVFVAVVTVMLIMIFKKKPETNRKSNRTHESRKSRSKYHN